MSGSLATIQRVKKSDFRPSKLSRDDVFGKHKFQDGKLIGREGGLVVATEGQKCPVFKDVLPQKAVTIVGLEKDFEEIEYWLEYIKGRGCITKEHTQDGHIALRAEYQAKQPLNQQPPQRSYRNPYLDERY